MINTYALILLLTLITLSVSLKNVEQFQQTDLEPSIKSNTVPNIEQNVETDPEQNVQPNPLKITEINDKLKVKTRGCQMHLTNDPELCNKLEPYYKMGNIQLQVAINNMKKLKTSSSRQAYNILRYIQSKKKQIPINSCKINIPGLLEIENNEIDSSKYPFKSIASYVEYDPTSFKGYCLLDTNYDTDKISVQMKIDKDYSDFMNSDNMILTSQIEDVNSDNTTYAAVEFKGDVYSTILNNSKQLCKTNNKNIDIPDKAIFIKISCHLENIQKISASKVEIVEYAKKENKFIKIEKYEQEKTKPPTKQLVEPRDPKDATNAVPDDTIDDSSQQPPQTDNNQESNIQEPKNSDSKEIMKQFEEGCFGFTYIENGALMFSSYSLSVKMYKFEFDICSTIQSYDITTEVTDPSDESKKNKIKFSFTEDLRVSPILIKQTLKIPFKDDTKIISESDDIRVTDDINGDIKNLINDKISNIGDENKDITNKLKEYDEALDKVAKNYVNLQSLCQENQDTYSSCIDRANINFGNLYKLISITKTGLSDLIQRNIATRDSLKNVLEVMSITKFTIEDLNEDILNNTPKNNDGSLRNKGVSISYDKFTPYVSNDDCIYFQIS